MIQALHDLSFTMRICVAAFTWIFVWLGRKWLAAKKALKQLSEVSPPGGSLLFVHPFRATTVAAGSYIPPKDQIGYLYGKFSSHRKYGTTYLVSATFWDATPTYWVADADALKIINTDRLTFVKDMGGYDPINIYGKNMLISEGSEWKRHRDISKNAFNEANNAYVWRETVRVVNEWCFEIDKTASLASSEQSTVPVDLVRDLTRATLLIISAAGFGRRSAWLEDGSPPPGRRISFTPAMMGAFRKIFHRALTPKPIWNAIIEKGLYIPFIGPIVQETNAAFEENRNHLVDLLSQARDQLTTARVEPIGVAGENEDGVLGAVLLRNLVEANMSFEKDTESGYRSLSDLEVMSNMFLFFLAGHETSAHTLCFAFVYLALYPECQQRVYEEALKIYPDGVPAVASASSYKSNVPQLEYTFAVFYETLRLIPSVPRLVKIATKDTVIKCRKFTTSPDGKTEVTGTVNVPIPKGANCVMDITALHNNPIHWGDDVEDFNPSRFIDTDTYRWPRDAFLAFSGGPRSCIGQRFAVTESLCILASMVRRYEILPPEDVMGLDLKEQERILLKWMAGITARPSNARVRFRKRDV